MKQVTVNEIQTGPRTIAVICGLIAAAEGLMVLFSWIVGWRGLARISSDFIPIAPNLAFAFLTLGSILAVMALASVHGWSLWMVRTATIALCMFASIPVLEYLFDFDSSVNDFIFASQDLFQGIP